LRTHICVSWYTGKGIIAGPDSTGTMYYQSERNRLNIFYTDN